jgi:hypothetical protein
MNRLSLFAIAVLFAVAAMAQTPTAFAGPPK